MPVSRHDTEPNAARLQYSIAQSQQQPKPLTACQSNAAIVFPPNDLLTSSRRYLLCIRVQSPQAGIDMLGACNPKK
jgi:hypothetical protein